MIYKVEKYIATHNLISDRGKVLVALSGGADSVALLVALCKLGYDCEAIHCNFHLRAEESNRDEEFVKELCSRRRVKLHIVHFDTGKYARDNKVSIEMAARELRYTAFEKYRKDINAEAIAVAHHKDDSAETILLNLIRGTGIKGLHGIQPKNGHIVRPLLCVSRNDILDYLEWRGETYVTDSTNLTSDYTRNKIRLEIIPKLAEINPSILDSLAATGEKLREAEKIYQKAVHQAIEKVKREDTISIEALKEETSPATILHEILAPLGFNSTQVANIMECIGSEGTKEVTSGQWCVIKERDILRIAKKENMTFTQLTLPDEGSVSTLYGTLQVVQTVFDGNISKERETATLDCSKLHFPLTLRQTENGDRFAPFGMRGTKLVSDYLTDRKKSIIEKRQQLVVTDAKGDIVWLVGERPAAMACVKETTKNVLVLKWVKE